ncbi:CD48 antigen-like isoform X2 [Neoarius graeffei]|uniref:CD48 antigen-like isoform X2 n=1 Tax=Neoarius graeffei TaxID=443677 RepID=UPI00298D528D|nr:CD48 antigen-like isoform X2 [Neoarius graeffei]
MEKNIQLRHTMAHENVLVEFRTLWTLLYLLCWVRSTLSTPASHFPCPSGDETATLQKVEGTTLTLCTGITGIQSDVQIMWLYGPEKAETRILNSQNGKTATEISEKFKDRLQLNRTNGDLTIRNISRNLSGVYFLQVFTERVSSRTFSVTVYAPVSTPVLKTQGKKGSRMCSILCKVQNGKDVKLSWYRENERISITNNTDLSVPLSLTLQIQHHDNNAYNCEAVNPVSRKTASLDIAGLCYNNSGTALLPALTSATFFVLLIIFVSVWLGQ